MAEQRLNKWKLSLDGNGAEAVIDIWGELVDEKEWVEDFYFSRTYSSEKFAKDIQRCAGCSKVRVNINSIGGDLFFGVAAYNTLRALGAKIETHVIGIAASAATMIFCAGDERIAEPGCVFMGHGASVYMQQRGFFNDKSLRAAADELAQTLESLDKCNASVSEIYAAVSGKPAAEWLAKIVDGGEVWMNADELVESKIATAKGEHQAAQMSIANVGGKFQLWSGDKLLTKDFHAPANAGALGIKTRAEAAGAGAPGAEAHNRETEKNMHTDANNTGAKEDAKPQNTQPSNPPAPANDGTANTAKDTAQAVHDAVIADRKRIAAIEARAAKLGDAVDAELVNAAKFGDKDGNVMSADAFAAAALDAMDMGKMYQAQRKDEMQETEGVEAAPAAATEPGNDTKNKRDEHGVRSDVSDMLKKYDARHQKKNNNTK